MVVVGAAVIVTVVVVLVGVAAVDAGVVVILLLVGVVIAVVYSRGRRLLSFVAELVFDYLVSEMQSFHVPNPVVVLTLVLVPEHADLRLIPTDARGGGIPPVVVPVVPVVPVVLVPEVRSVVPGVLGPAGCTPVGSTHAPS